MFHIEIDGEPKPKGRPRFTRSGHAYTPKETKEAEQVIIDAWEKVNSPKLDGELLVKCEFHVGTKRRKDLDNMLKLVLDALNKRAFDDDSQIVRIEACKKLLRLPKTIIEVHEIE